MKTLPLSNTLILLAWHIYVNVAAELGEDKKDVETLTNASSSSTSEKEANIVKNTEFLAIIQIVDTLSGSYNKTFHVHIVNPRESQTNVGETYYDVKPKVCVREALSLEEVLESVSKIEEGIKIYIDDNKVGYRTRISLAKMPTASMVFELTKNPLFKRVEHTILSTPFKFTEKELDLIESNKNAEIDVGSEGNPRLFRVNFIKENNDSTQMVRMKINSNILGYTSTNYVTDWQNITKLDKENFNQAVVSILYIYNKENRLAGIPKTEKNVTVINTDEGILLKLC